MKDVNFDNLDHLIATFCEDLNHCPSEKLEIYCPYYKFWMDDRMCDDASCIRTVTNWLETQKKEGEESGRKLWHR